MEQTNRPRVVIYGGGITGLSAAHELAERGFEVHIVEKNQRPYRSNDCDIGGIARTQWIYREDFEGHFNVATSVMSDRKGLGHIWPTNRKIRFKPGSWRLDDEPGLDAWLRELAADLLELITDTSSQWFTRKRDEQRTKSGQAAPTTWYSYLTVEGFASRWETLDHTRLNDWRDDLRRHRDKLGANSDDATRAVLQAIRDELRAEFAGLPEKMYRSMWTQNGNMLELMFLELIDRRYVVPPMSERWVYGLSLMRSYVLLGRLYDALQTYRDTDADDGVCREVANLQADDLALLRRFTLPLSTIFTNTDDCEGNALIGRLFSDRLGQPCLLPSPGDRKATVVMQPYTLLNPRIFSTDDPTSVNAEVKTDLRKRLRKLEQVIRAQPDLDMRERLLERLDAMKNDLDQLAREVVGFRDGPAYTAIVNSNHDGVRARLELIPMALGESDDPDRQPIRRPLPPLSMSEGIEKSMEQELEPEHRMAYAGLNFIENLMPGEHGYRYFPAFYHNLFDTMKRTPILERRDMTPLEHARLREWQHTVHQIQRAKQKARTSAIKPSDVDPLLPPAYIETGKTVFDNLLPNSSHAIADEDNRRPYEMPRSELRSTAELMRQLRYMMDKRGFTGADMTSFSLKMLQYLTSCPERREQQYEGITWWEFLEADKRSAQYQATLDQWPQALVGLRSKEGDARSIGSVSVQLMADQLMPSGYRDGTLNGPTSVAWLDPWRRYLEARGVRFHHGWLDAVEKSKDGRRVSIRHYLHEGAHTGKRYTDRDADARDRLSQEPAEALTPHPDQPHFSRGTLDEGALVVLATPLYDTWKILRPDRAPGGGRERGAFYDDDDDLGRLARFLEDDTEQRLEEAHPDSPLQHYAGMQFYIDFELGPEKGHVYYAGTPWRLSSISQAQFWTHRNESEYLGVLSVVIGSWSLAGEESRAPAWALPPSQIAREVWHQLSARLESAGKHIPEPRAYHIDDEIRFGSVDDCGGPIRPLENRTPYQINRVRDWKKRPGRLDTDGYAVMYDRLVLAGPHMKTHTRLVTMEAANESARHAVNGLLHHHIQQRQAHEDQTGEVPPRYVTVHRCPVHNIEEHEPGDLMLLKELDEKLLAKGLPHFLEILEADKLIADPTLPLLRALGGLGGPTRDAIAALLEAIRG